MSGTKPGQLPAALLAICLIVTVLCPRSWAAPGDVIADHVLGQRDFTHGGPLNSILAGLYFPYGVAIDTSSTPHHLYIADTGNNRVLGYKDTAALVNGANPDLVIGQSDFVQNSQNQGSSVSATGFCQPVGITLDPSGNLYVADRCNNRVLVFKQPFKQSLTTNLAASWVYGQGSAGTIYTTNGAATSQTGMNSPRDVAVDSSGNVFVADTGNNRVIQFAPPFSAVFRAQALAVIGQASLTDFTEAVCANGQGGNPMPSRTSLCAPDSVATGNLGEAKNEQDFYIADTGNNRVLEFLFAETDGVVNTNSAYTEFGQTSFSGNAPGAEAMGLNGPTMVRFLNGQLFMADHNNNRVIDFPVANANFTAVFEWGSGNATNFSAPKCTPGSPTQTNLCLPWGVAFDGTDLYVADSSDARVVRYPNALKPNVTPNLVVGQPNFIYGQNYYATRNGLYFPTQVAFDNSSVPGHFYVVDDNNSRVLGFTASSPITNDALAALVIGQPDFFAFACNHNKPAPDATTLCFPRGAFVDSAGNLWVTDEANHRVLEYSNPFKSGMVANQPAHLVVGQGTSGTNFTSNVPGTGNTALDSPYGVFVDTAGNLYVGDNGNSRVVEFDRPLLNDVIADRVFGQPDFTQNKPNRGGAPGPGTLNFPYDVFVDASNRVWIADRGNCRVLEYDEPGLPPGNFRANRVFGQGPAIAAPVSFTTKNCGISASALHYPSTVRLDRNGNLFVNDAYTNRVLEFNHPLTNGIANLVFGQGPAGTSFTTSMPGTSASLFHSPQGITFDAFGNLFVADSSNERVLEFDMPLGPSPTPAPTRTHTSTPKRTPVRPCSTELPCSREFYGIPR